MAQDIVDATQELSDKQKKILNYEETLEELANKATSLEEELRLTEKKLEELAQRGITQKRLTHLNEMDISSWQDLLDRVSASQKYEELAKQNQSIAVEVDVLRSEKMQLEEKLIQFGEDVKSEENRLDQTKREHSLTLESVEILSAFLESGYTPEVLRELLLRFRQLSIRGEPVASVKRFLTRMGSVKEYEELENQIISKREELEALKRNLNETRGTYRALKKGVLEPIQVTQEEAIRSINSVVEEASKQIISRSEVVDDFLKEIRDEAIAAITITEGSGRTAISECQVQLVDILKESSALTFKVLDKLDEDINRWGQIREDAGKYQADIRRADLILGITKDPRTLTQIPLHIVSKLLEGIVNYVSGKYSNVKVEAPANVKKIEGGHVVYQNIRLSSLAEWLNHGIMRMLQEGVLYEL